MQNSEPRHNAFDEIRAKLPPTFTRQDIPVFIPGVISPTYLARLDCMGKGPERFKITNRWHYRRDSFITWLANR